jgi:hypothetical protein
MLVTCVGASGLMAVISFFTTRRDFGSVASWLIVCSNTPLVVSGVLMSGLWYSAFLITVACCTANVDMMVARIGGTPAPQLNDPVFTQYEHIGTRSTRVDRLVHEYSNLKQQLHADAVTFRWMVLPLFGLAVVAMSKCVWGYLAQDEAIGILDMGGIALAVAVLLLALVPIVVAHTYLQDAFRIGHLSAKEGGNLCQYSLEERTYLLQVFDRDPLAFPVLWITYNFCTLFGVMATVLAPVALLRFEHQ